MTRGDYSDAFHTYAVEWSEDYIYTWVDTRLVVLLPSISFSALLSDPFVERVEVDMS
jgi:hypothetical protein